MNQWLSVVLGAGGTGFIIAVFQGISQLRQTSANRAGKLLTDLEKARNDADARAQDARDDSTYWIDVADYWRDRCGTAEFHARSEGVTLPEPKALPERPRPKINEV